MAGTQLIAATPGISLGCEFYMPPHVLTQNVLEERIPDRDGRVIVPNAPGLGIRPPTPTIYFFGALVTCQTKVAKGISRAP